MTFNHGALAFHRVSNFFLEISVASASGFASHGWRVVTARPSPVTISAQDPLNGAGGSTMYTSPNAGVV